MGPDGEALPPGAPGEIRVRGPTLMRGYHGLPEETARALRGGWLHTGDAGVLAEHPAVREVAVVGRPDPHFGERPVAYFVAPGPPPEPAALAAFCRTRLAGYKVPVAFHRMGSLPRNALGKLLRRELRSGGEEGVGASMPGEGEPGEREPSGPSS